MNVILMKSSNNEGDRVPRGHILSPNEASNTRTQIQPIELLARVGQRNPQTTQAVGKTICCSLQTDGKDPLLITTLTQLIDHGQVKLVSK